MKRPPSHAVPLPTTAWCLFLDVDGTLLELADHPGAVFVDPALKAAAHAAALGCERGRGRWSAAAPLPISTGCSTTSTSRSPGCTAASDGRARRAAHRADGDRAIGRGARAACSGSAARHPGLLLEDKGAGLALHFLQARELEHELRAEVALLAAPLVPNFALLDGHAVIEVKPAAHTKDSAVSAFMEEEPFRGRQPIFIGDDQTDYGGFAAVRRFGGLAIAVGPRVKSEWWLPGPADVRQWLGELAGSGR